MPSNCVMKAVYILLAFLAVFLCGLCAPFSAAQQCVNMKEKPYFAPCLAAGYNTTYPIPSYVSERTTGYVGWWNKFFISRVRNCSVPQIAAAVGCASYAPYCKDGSTTPLSALLPCRRVCVEFLKRCQGSIPEWIIDDTIGRCAVLPDYPKASGKCYEPPQFTDLHINTSAKGKERYKCMRTVYY